MKRRQAVWRWLSLPVFAGMVWVAVVNTMAVANEIRYGMARVGASNQHDKADALVAAWQPGTQVQVYYDPGRAWLASFKQAS